MKVYLNISGISIERRMMCVFWLAPQIQCGRQTRQQRENENYKEADLPIP
jgi:hypothetical protein